FILASYATTVQALRRCPVVANGVSPEVNFPSRLNRSLSGPRARLDAELRGPHELADGMRGCGPTALSDSGHTTWCRVTGSVGTGLGLGLAASPNRRSPCARRRTRLRRRGGAARAKIPGRPWGRSLRACRPAARVRRAEARPIYSIFSPHWGVSAR